MLSAAEREHRTCLVKRSHRTWREAHAMVRWLRRQDVDDAHTLVVYRCRYCAAWHVGNDKERDTWR